jgi:hypothetical protein
MLEPFALDDILRRRDKAFYHTASTAENVRFAFVDPASAIAAASLTRVHHSFHRETPDTFRYSFSSENDAGENEQ